MYVKSIRINNFRNFSQQELDVFNGINILFGDNAQGKTNFLEALYLSGTGRSWRTNSERELILFGSEEAYIEVVVCNNDIVDKIGVYLSKDMKKVITVNHNQIKKLGELYGILCIVVFSPDDLSLVKAGPLQRRKFMDVELCQLNKIYYYNLKQYYHVLKQRNNLLKEISRDSSLKDTLSVWDEQLSIFGCKIIEYRRDFINDIQEYGTRIHKEISNSSEELKIMYHSSIREDEFIARLKKNRERDIYLGSTTQGIHKDDLVFNINGNDARIYGSQGQQRSVCLSVKLAEIKLIKEKKNIQPVLLLDDVLSELDEGRQRYLLDCIGDVQTFITSTGVEAVTGKLRGNKQVYRVCGGVIESV